MNENENVQNEALQEEKPTADSQQEIANSADQPKRLKRNNVKDQFKEKNDQVEKESKPAMNKEETIVFYNENLPFMRLQDEYEELLYKFHERKVKNLELQVREVEAIGYLAQWKAGQDDAKRRADHEAKMKEEWEKMSPEEQEEWKKKAKDNLAQMEKQAKEGAGMGVVYDGTNAGQILSFVEGVPFDPNRVVEVENEKKQICFHIPDESTGGTTQICMVPGQLIERLENGQFIVSFQ